MQGGEDVWEAQGTASGHRLSEISDSNATWMIEHDPLGRVTTALDKEYEYDPLGKLVLARDTNGDLLESYLMTADGRIAQIQRHDAQGFTASMFAYDGAQMAASFTEGTGGTWTQDWQAVWGPGQDQLLEFHDFHTGKTFAVAQDHRNNVVALLDDATGTLDRVMHYTPEGLSTHYDDAGQVLCDEEASLVVTCTELNMPFGFNGMWRSKTTGLSHMRNRWYSPQLGQFMSHDPLEYIDSYDLYAFAKLDPINFWDPWGLSGGQTVPDANEPGIGETILDGLGTLARGVGMVIGAIAVGVAYAAMGIGSAVADLFSSSGSADTTAADSHHVDHSVGSSNENASTGESPSRSVGGGGGGVGATGSLGIHGVPIPVVAAGKAAAAAAAAIAFILKGRKLIPYVREAISKTRDALKDPKLRRKIKKKVNKVRSYAFRIPKDVIEKIPKNFKRMPNKDGVGMRWLDPKNKSTGVRIDKGNPKSQWPSQQVDHVIVNVNGKVIGRNGKPIKWVHKTKCRRGAHPFIRIQDLENMEFQMTVLKSPYRRQELIEHLDALSDIEYQRRAWVENRTDAFSFAIHFFLDDTALVDDPEAYIGYFLVDETEARAVQKVALAIDYILEEEGTMSDAEFIELEDWPKVVNAAAEARTLVHQIPFDPDSIPD